MRVKCIFQGGGANLATLLCAVEALGQLEDEGFLEISEVAGTSAGSLAAACLAHPRQNAELIQRIVSIASDKIDQFKIPKTRAGLIWKLAWGSSLIDEQKLESIVRDFFKIDNKDFSFEDAKYPLYICASDIRRSNPVIFKKGTEKPLDEALTDSCAIPFVFRGHSKRSALADGGVMANLLDGSVFNDEGAHTLAFSFARSGVTDFNGTISYAKSIFGSMIENAVEDAKIRILQSGGYVCELPSIFGTLSFDEALQELKRDDRREELVAKCKESIREGLENFNSNSSLLSYGDRMAQIQGLVDNAFNQIKMRNPYKVIECVIACEANCLFPKSDSRSRNPDLQTKRVKIAPLGVGLQFFRIGIARGSDFKLMNEISCRVFDGRGERLSAKFEVSTNVEQGEPIHRLCVVLGDWQSSENGPFTVTMTTTHQQGLMEGLLEPGGNEWMRAEAHRDDEIETQDFVLLLPKAFRKLHLSDLRDNLRRCKSPPRNLEVDDSDWVVGREMSEDELDKHQSWLQPDPGFRYIGWRTNNVTGRSSSGVLIEQDIGV